MHSLDRMPLPSSSLSAAKDRTWSGLLTLSRGWATRSTTERGDCRNKSAKLRMFRRKLKLLFRKRLGIAANPHIPFDYSNINTYGEFIWNRGWNAALPHHFQSKLW